MARIISLTLLLLAAGTAWPQADEPSRMRGFYSGAGFGIANVYSWEESCCGWSDWEYGESDVAYTFTGGFRFMRYLALEASYIDSGTPEWDEDFVFIGDLADVFSVNAKIDITSWQVNVLGILPFLEIWEVYLRAGVASWDADSRQVLTRASDGVVTTRRIDETGADFTIGVGAGMTLRDRWQFRLDYAYFGIDDDLMALGSNDDANTDFLTLQLIWRIGEHW